MIVTEDLPQLAAAVCGVTALPRLSTFYRLLLLQVLLCIIVDTYAHALSHLGRENGYVYDSFMLPEVVLLLLSAQACFGSTRSRRVLLLVFFIFITAYITNLYYIWGKTPFPFANYAAVTEGLIFACISLFMLYAEFIKREDIRSRLPVMLVALGLLVYFAISIPYLGNIERLLSKDLVQDRKLFLILVVACSAVRYGLIAAAFCMVAYRGKPQAKRVIA